jgi:hypothetical protein
LLLIAHYQLLEQGCEATIAASILIGRPACRDLMTGPGQDNRTLRRLSLPIESN